MSDFRSMNWAWTRVAPTIPGRVAYGRMTSAGTGALVAPVARGESPSVFNEERQ